MKRYIRSSVLTEQQYAKAVDIANQRLSKFNSEVRFFEPNSYSNIGGTLTKLEGDSSFIDSKGNFTYKGYVGEVNHLWIDIRPIEFHDNYNEIPEEINKFISRAKSNLQLMKEIVDVRLPECKQLAAELENKIANKLSAKYDNVAVDIQFDPVYSNGIDFRLDTVNERDRYPLFIFKVDIDGSTYTDRIDYKEFIQDTVPDDILKSIRTMQKSEQIDKNTKSNSSLIKILQDAGIDTTMSKYQLKGQKYERYEDGAIYTLNFKCPGDWLAYLSMCIHKSPTLPKVKEHLGLDYLMELIDDYPTLEAIMAYASKNWWGDGDDYIIYLKNLDTNEYLYGPEQVEEEYEEDWED